ncbi:MAG: transporter substrate-binding domain-containing protein, partial [Pseudomonadota bacterium]
MKFAYLIEPPFNYVDASGRVTGCDVELAKYVCAEIGIAGFEPVETEFAELLPGVRDGKWRMTTGLFGTDERRKNALFSRPIWALPDGLLVASGNQKGLSGYQSVAENSDVRLAVVRDQFQHRSAIEFGVSADRILIF